jgi:hypothetical protein
MVTWLLFGVLSVSPGASSTMPKGVPAIGRRENCSARRLTAPAGDVTGAGRAPLTTTTSLTGAIDST